MSELIASPKSVEEWIAAGENQIPNQTLILLEAKNITHNGIYMKNESSILVDKTKQCEDTDDDAKAFINHVVNQKFPLISLMWNYCCCCRYCPKTFTLIVLAQIVDLELIERFSLVVRFLIVSLLILLFGGSENFLPILILETIISVISRCKVDFCIAKLTEFRNPVVQFFVGVCRFEDILILVCSLPFSFVETCLLRLRKFGSLEDPPVLQGRENVVKIELKDLIADMNKSVDRYCFIRVLEMSDRISFLAKLPQKADLVDIYQRKAIKLSIWLEVMGSITLSTTYIIYRRAYWGEHRGKRTISEKFTNHLVPLWQFDKTEEKPLSFSIDDLTRIFQKLTVRDPVTRIILEDNHMSCFEFSSQYRLSSWENRDYEIKDRRCGRQC